MRSRRRSHGLARWRLSHPVVPVLALLVPMLMTLPVISMLVAVFMAVFVTLACVAVFVSMFAMFVAFVAYPMSI